MRSHKRQRLSKRSRRTSPPARARHGDMNTLLSLGLQTDIRPLPQDHFGTGAVLCFQPLNHRHELHAALGARCPQHAALGARCPTPAAAQPGLGRGSQQEAGHAVTHRSGPGLWLLMNAQVPDHQHTRPARAPAERALAWEASG